MKIWDCIDNHPFLTGIVLLELLGIANTAINGRRGVHVHGHIGGCQAEETEDNEVETATDTTEA